PPAGAPARRGLRRRADGERGAGQPRHLGQHPRRTGHRHVQEGPLMANRIEIQLDDSQVRQRLDQLMGALADSRPLMAGIAAELAAQTELAFQDQGPGWAKLKPATIRAREKAGKWPGQILQVSNALARSITTRSGPDFAQIGSNVPYAAIHQFG